MPKGNPFSRPPKHEGYADRFNGPMFSTLDEQQQVLAMFGLDRISAGVQILSRDPGARRLADFLDPDRFHQPRAPTPTFYRCALCDVDIDKSAYARHVARVHPEMSQTITPPRRATINPQRPPKPKRPARDEQPYPLAWNDLLATVNNVIAVHPRPLNPQALLTAWAAVYHTISAYTLAAGISLLATLDSDDLPYGHA